MRLSRKEDYDGHARRSQNTLFLPTCTLITYTESGPGKKETTWKTKEKTERFIFKEDVEAFEAKDIGKPKQ